MYGTKLPTDVQDAPNRTQAADENELWQSTRYVGECRPRVTGPGIAPDHKDAPLTGASSATHSPRG